MRGYPKWFYRFLIFSFTLLTLTGFLLIPNALDMRLDWDVSWHLPGAMRLAVVALHATIAFLVVSQLGALWSVHMRIGWRHHKNLPTGLGLVAVLLGLVLTGLGIYYAGEDWSVPASASHIIIGIFIPFVLVWHIMAARHKQKLR
ncbi:MAG: hypothetical protein H0W85_02600 [Methylotenera sp.]|nr:hypothetical protein [Methylotenera sp.]